MKWDSRRRKPHHSTPTIRERRDQLRLARQAQELDDEVRRRAVAAGLLPAVNDPETGTTR